MNDLRPYMDEFDKLYEDASYSAQSYFEAAKSALFWSKTIVFVPAVLATVAAFAVAMGGARQWSALAAIAGAVSATASFMGSDKVASSYKDSGRRFTQMRHTVGLERSFASGRSNVAELKDVLRVLRNEYAEIVGASELIPNRLFSRVQKRIRKGVLSYEDS